MKLRDDAGRIDLPRLVRHGAGFLISGTAAFCVDVVLLRALTTGLGIDPFIARLFSIAGAMIVGWLSHRRLTFAVAMPPTVAEFLRYAGVAWFSAAVNYLVFVAILLMWEEIDPALAVAMAAIVAMCVSYFGMRLAAFRLPAA